MTTEKHKPVAMHGTITLQCVTCKKEFEYKSPNLFDEEAVKKVENPVQAICPHCDSVKEIEEYE